MSQDYESQVRLDRLESRAEVLRSAIVDTLYHLDQEGDLDPWALSYAKSRLRVALTWDGEFQSSDRSSTAG